MFSEHIVIFTSILDDKTQCRILEECENKGCTTERYDDYSIKVVGAKSQLFALLLELTYDYHLWLD